MSRKMPIDAWVLDSRTRALRPLRLPKDLFLSVVLAASHRGAL